MKYYNISFNEIYCANIRINGTNKNYNTSKRDIKINKSSNNKESFPKGTLSMQTELQRILVNNPDILKILLRLNVIDLDNHPSKDKESFFRETTLKLKPSE
ncbi:hypothetical protein PCHDK_000527800 [Plasmodium chabaudi adami]|uniref:Fam-c protein n=1 Tax=Plasmodium chabaudi adami TaxID=5826 RepID=A0A1D3LA23_PLACE|nr:hypothetical protein PCHDK_000527800 [Plasmodium chabaudi adami]